MGLGLHAVEAIVREHLFRPIQGDVLLMGRQTVYYTRHDLLRHLSELGLDTSKAEPNSIDLDSQTVHRRPDMLLPEFVSDRALFRLLGLGNVRALDHSPYEGADVIHDLRFPIPPRLHGIADFIVDGSTLDNVFTPSVVLRNYCELLRPGGRLIAVNAFSGHDTPYVIMPPHWYLDYFILNGFADAKIYVAVFFEGGNNVFYVDIDHLRQAKRSMPRIRSPYHMATVVFAEKGRTSTADRLPIQQDYRSAAEWDEFDRNLAEMQKCKRHHLVRSLSLPIVGVQVGYHFIDENFIARPHATRLGDEIHRRDAALEEQPRQLDEKLREYRTALNETKVLLQGAREDAVRLSGELQEMQGSLSWRATAPLRRLWRLRTRLVQLLRRGVATVWRAPTSRPGT